jgi:hypothetical protein
MKLPIRLQFQTPEQRDAMNLLGVQLYAITFISCPILFMVVDASTAFDPLYLTYMLLAISTMITLFVTAFHANKAAAELDMPSARVAPQFVLGLIPVLVVLTVVTFLLGAFAAAIALLAIYMTLGGGASILTSLYTINQARKRRRAITVVRKLGCGGEHNAQPQPTALPDSAQLPTSDLGTQRSITALKSSTE